MTEMDKLTQTQIIDEIKNNDEVTAVEIIINHKNILECSVIISDELFSYGYETTYNNELISEIKKAIRGKEILLIQFIDTELPEAWKQSYLAGGIPEERHDRRVIFHPYNDMNELYCVDRNLLWDITDKFKGTPHELTEDKCCWRWNIIQWYKKHLI